MSRPTPTLRGWTVGVCGVIALVGAALLSSQVLLFVGVLLTLAPLAAMAAIALDRPALTVDRSFVPASVAAGEAAEVRLRVRNESARPTPDFTWVDALPPQIASVAKQSFPSLAAATGTGVSRGSEAQTLRYSARTLRRGAYLVGPLRIERTDPFGLARCGYEVGESKALLVTPRVSLLGAGGADQARGEGTDPELVRHSIPSADEVIPREYHPGDPLRRVQWRATARLGRIMVRQEEQLSNPAAWVLLDTVAARPGASEAFERAVELAASVALHLLELGYLVDVHETGERQLTGSYELPGGDHLLIGQLASVAQTRDVDGDYAGRLALALRAGGTAPAFAILVDGDEASWRELAALRRFADPAIVFLATPAAQAAEAALGEAGWVCVPLDEQTDASAAWSRATAAHDRHRQARYRGGSRV